MSIELSLTVYGPQLALALVDDDEELAQFFQTVSCLPHIAVMGDVIAEYLDDADAVISFLRTFADSIEGAK
ncbi:MAG: hypothetical protein V4712_15095 [Pseudomonadota bacterium]